MSYQTLIFNKEEGLATITLNRPDKLNAICPELITDLIDVIEQVARDDEVRSVLLTGAGRAFCAGGDIGDLLASSSENPVELINTGKQGATIVSGIRNMPKPWISAVNGPAIGAGCNLALCCDIIVAAQHAVFSQAFMNLGLHPDTGGVYLLTRLVGTSRACELIFTGKAIDANEAERIGLINQVVPADQLESTAKEMALRLAKGPSRAIGMAKATIYQGMTMDMEPLLEAEVRAICLSMATEDAKEGIKAILEKRKPEFKGN